jgi:hypothetical protein
MRATRAARRDPLRLQIATKDDGVGTTLFVLAVTNCSPSLVWYPFAGNNPEHPAPLRIQPIASSVSNSVQSTCSPSGLCAIPASTFSHGVRRRESRDNLIRSALAFKLAAHPFQVLQRQREAAVRGDVFDRGCSRPALSLLVGHSASTRAPRIRPSPGWASCSPRRAVRIAVARSVMLRRPACLSAADTCARVSRAARAGSGAWPGSSRVSGASRSSKASSAAGSTHATGAAAAALRGSFPRSSS